MNRAENYFIRLLELMGGLLGLLSGILLGFVFLIYVGYSEIGLEEVRPGESALQLNAATLQESKALVDPVGMWKSPDWSLVAKEPNAASITYGRALIANTSEFLGPNGKVRKISNGLNCQNCHLQAGTLPLGNNFGAVAATYPKVRGRSGLEEDIPKRINDCFERSLNGQALSRDSKEMIAMVSYMQWLGRDVPKGQKPKGVGIYSVPLLDRAADPIRGKTVYTNQCASCHQEDGQGVLKADGSGYLYPPLWGVSSYNKGAGLYRLSRFAGYVRANMPLGATFEAPLLSAEDSWDVAAYVNSLDRPELDLSGDWPDISKKPMDHPFGPYQDSFSEIDHKYGPFQPILDAKKSTQ